MEIPRLRRVLPAAAGISAKTHDSSCIEFAKYCETIFSATESDLDESFPPGLRLVVPGSTGDPVADSFRPRFHLMLLRSAHDRLHDGVLSQSFPPKTSFAPGWSGVYSFF